VYALETVQDSVTSLLVEKCVVFTLLCWDHLKFSVVVPRIIHSRQWTLGPWSSY